MRRLPPGTVMDSPEARERRLLYLRASIKLLVTIGLLFLLVPFFKSLTLPGGELPADATMLAEDSLAAGETREVRLADGSHVFVTRGSEAVAAQLQAFPARLLWSPSAPGLVNQDWFVLQAQSALDEPVRHLPASGAWPGGFVAASGAAWDVAGRALKPWPGHPGGQARTVQNLLPMPWRVRDGKLYLVPVPARAP